MTMTLPHALTPLTPMPPTVVTLTPCWYARDHEPMHPPLELEAGDLAYDRCRHCHRAIVSPDLRRWHIAGGFNMEAWGSPRAQPCLAVVDEQQERVIARFPIKDSSATGVSALRARVCDDYHIGDPGSPFVLRDCRLPAHLAPMPPSGGYSARY
jgi:hypothetical protein